MFMTDGDGGDGTSSLMLISKNYPLATLMNIVPFNTAIHISRTYHSIEIRFLQTTFVLSLFLLYLELLWLKCLLNLLLKANCFITYE